METEHECNCRSFEVFSLAALLPVEVPKVCVSLGSAEASLQPPLHTPQSCSSTSPE